MEAWKYNLAFGFSASGAPMDVGGAGEREGGDGPPRFQVLFGSPRTREPKGLSEELRAGKPTGQLENRRAAPAEHEPGACQVDF